MIKKYYNTNFFQPGMRKIGETFSIDSGMGGSFTVELKKITDNFLIFDILNPGWKDRIRMTRQQAAKQIYCILF